MQIKHRNSTNGGSFETINESGTPMLTLKPFRKKAILIKQKEPVLSSTGSFPSYFSTDQLPIILPNSSNVILV